ncbi:hypothetical protein [Brucella gallinifaecis]|uniref:hypothetical protein n=1 Tax=Brucella gallinifaecis TaxID=215590 RepID=UPI00235F1CB7|nr:hypothetical protein [Brucella gallinifaecis]
MNIQEINKKLSNFDSHKRCFEFIAIFNELESSKENDQLFWNVLSFQWRSFDNVDHKTIENLMARFAYNESYLCDHVIKPSQRFKKAKDKVLGQKVITAFRGQKNFSLDQNTITGLAWTLKKSTAMQFAKYGFRGVTSGMSFVQQKSFIQSEVAFFDNSRDESELVIFSTDHLADAVQQLDYTPNVFGQ